MTVTHLSGWYFDARFGRARPDGHVPPPFRELTSNRHRPCEMGCEDGIARGERYRLIKRTEQRACVRCYVERWPDK